MGWWLDGWVSMEVVDGPLHASCKETPFIGMCLTESHKEGLLKHLAKVVFTGFWKEGGPFYDPRIAKERFFTIPPANPFPSFRRPTRYYRPHLPPSSPTSLPIHQPAVTIPSQAHLTGAPGGGDLNSHSGCDVNGAGDIFAAAGQREARDQGQSEARDQDQGEDDEGEG